MKVYELSFQKNIRDIGGLVTLDNHKIKEGRIYRGGALHNVSKEDIKIINSLHLTDIVDFRNEVEFVERPDYQFESVSFHNFPVLRNDGDKEAVKKHDDGNLLWFIKGNMTGHEHLRKTYGEMVLSENGINAYSSFFKLLLLDDKRTIYFHCSQGKDRGGLAAYLLEIALGVSHEDALKDYLFSNKAMEIRVHELLSMEQNKEYYTEEYAKSLLDVFFAKEEYLNEALKAINEKYGNTVNYIKNALNVDIDRLKEFYLE